jgi:hypothetical protein
MYWFSVQTRDLGGRYSPPTMEHAEPSLKVFVDTHPPVMKLRALPKKNSEVGVAWTISDDTFDPNKPDSLRLDYRLAGGDWQPLRVDPFATQYYFNPGSEGSVEIRLRARDQAENWGEEKITLDGDSQGASETGTPKKKPARFSPQPNTNVRMVKSKKFALSYDVKETGPSRVSTVDVWYTQDGSNWQKYKTQNCSDSPEKQPPYSIEINVSEEGLYGFSLVVHSGVGLSDPPPQVGDKPQVWVEVDTTKPEVQLNTIIVGRNADKGKLFINWMARDKNLAQKPITLYYTTQADGEWIKIADKLDNSGRYVWQMPSDVPYQFLVKIEAVDRAGNLGIDTTHGMVKVDLSQPKATILNVAPVEK